MAAVWYDRNKEAFVIKGAGFSIEAVVTSSGNIVADWIGDVLHIHQHHLDGLIVGLDVEWCLPKYEGSKAEDPITTMQISVGRRCLVFQVLHRDYIPAELYNFLEDSRFQICGVGIAEDAEKLYRGYSIDIPNLVDLRSLAVERTGRRELKQSGLKKLALEFASIVMEKEKKITLSDWGRQRLSKEQIAYAALDAFCSYKIGLNLMSLSAHPAEDQIIVPTGWFN